MADSKRQSIVEAAATALATITVTNGYASNAGSNVSEWRTTAIEADECPCLEWRDTGTSSDALDNAEWLHRMTFVVTGFVTGAAVADQARQIISDILVAVSGNVALNALIAWMDPPTEAQDIDVDQAGKRVASGTVTFALNYLTEKFNPYE